MMSNDDKPVYMLQLVRNFEAIGQDSAAPVPQSGAMVLASDDETGRSDAG